MQKFVAALLTLMLSACGLAATDTPSTTDRPPGTSTAQSSTTTVPAAVTTVALPATTTTTSDREWTIESHGLNPSIALGDRGELGSGCSPGTDDLPDGIWFGWIDDAGLDDIDFDLACLWPGRLEPAASNDSGRIRQIPVAPETVVFLRGEVITYTDWMGDLTVAVNAPGMPDNLPFWVFVNESVITEISEYPEAISWARSTTAWSGLGPGCCEGGAVAPPSPQGALPEVGWPADGVYWLSWSTPERTDRWIDVDMETGLDVTIGKWVLCSENPGQCPSSWVGAEVTVDDQAGTINRTIDLNRGLTVVIMPIFDETPLVGDGTAFGRLLTDMAVAVDTWAGDGRDLQGLSADPKFPFGVATGPGSTDRWPVGYRGPGGAHLTWLGWWLALEIRDGQPILYIHAGQIAG